MTKIKLGNSILISLIRSWMFQLVFVDGNIVQRAVHRTRASTRCGPSRSGWRITRTTGRCFRTKTALTRCVSSCTTRPWITVLFLDNFHVKRNLGDLFSLWTKQLESAFFSGRLNALAEKRATSARHLKIWFCNQLFKWPLATRRWSLKYWISW